MDNPRRRNSDITLYSAMGVFHWLIVLMWVVSVPLIMQMNTPAAFVAAGLATSVALIPVIRKLLARRHYEFWMAVTVLMLAFITWHLSGILFALTGVMFMPVWVVAIALHIALTMVMLLISYIQTASAQHLFKWFTPLFIYISAVTFVRLFFNDLDPTVLKNMYQVIDIALMILGIEAIFMRNRGGIVIRILGGIFLVWATMDFLDVFASTSYGNVDSFNWTPHYTRIQLVMLVSFISIVGICSLFDETMFFGHKIHNEMVDYSFGFTADLTLTFLPVFILLSPHHIESGPIFVVSAACFLSAAIVLINYRRLQTTLNRKNNQLSNVAFTDDLTDIYNRTGLQEHIDEIIYNHISVFFIDLNGFKAINDTYGHAAGDDLLKTLAGRLSDVLPVEAVLARYGGDEFVALVKESTPEMDTIMSRRIVDQISLPVMFGEHTLRVSATVGISHGRHGDNLISLIEHADSDMYIKKSAYYEAMGTDRRR